MAILPRISHLRFQALFALVVLLALPAAALADGGASSGRQAPAHIIFGQTPQSDFQWHQRPVPRRTNAADRQAYFGSGSFYSDTLAGLQAQMDAIRARENLEGLPLTPAQEAAKSEMPPALVRALALAKQAREDTGIDD